MSFVEGGPGGTGSVLHSGFNRVPSVEVPDVAVAVLHRPNTNPNLNRMLLPVHVQGEEKQSVVKKKIKSWARKYVQ
jgi:hypothetical protein